MQATLTLRSQEGIHLSYEAIFEKLSDLERDDIEWRQKTLVGPRFNDMREENLLMFIGNIDKAYKDLFGTLRGLSASIGPFGIKDYEILTEIKHDRVEGSR